MVRKLALAVSLALGSLPLSVYGIGLGEIKTHSALNQNFNAEIQLLSVPRGELDTVRVKLASREAFARIGSEYSFTLSQLKFKPVRMRDGSTVIKVTSENVIREPFLDFLVEVNWPNGRMVKEYTVLLDPPLTTKRRPAKISSAGISKTRQTSGSTGSNAGAASYRAVGADEYGPVAANETLWEIASQLKPQGVTIHQMMMALLQANPRAFINNNVNLLKKGQVLRVPDAGEIQALNGAEAKSSFEQQTEDWMSNSVGDSGEAVVADSDAPAEQSAATAVEDENARLQIAAAAPEENDGEAGAGETDADGQLSAEALKRELMISRENEETTRQEADDLKAKVSDMELQVDDMKRLLTLKDEQLAQLQAGLPDTEEATDSMEETAEPALEEEPVAEDQQMADTDSTEMLSAADESMAEQESAMASEAEPVVADDATDVDEAQQEMAESTTDSDSDSAAVSESLSEEPPAVEEAAAAPAVEIETQEPVAEVETQEPAAEAEPQEAAVEAETQEPAVAGKETQQTSWLEDNLGMIGAVAGGLFGIGLLIALLGGNREKKASVEDESAGGAAQPDVSDDVADVSEAAQVEHDTSFLSEYSTEDLQALQEDTAEVDPVAEADVYIAYGRYEQAQQILADAIAGGDDSAATRYKMLEVYFATQNKQGFMELAESMIQSSQDKEDPKAWAHIQTMGRELDAANPLFGAAGGATGEAEESELTLDLSRLAEELDSTLNEDTESMEGLESLDLDLSAFSMESDTPNAEEKTVEEEKETAKGALELESALAETELHTEMADFSQLEDLADHTLDNELADLSSDLLDVMADSAILDEPLDIEADPLNSLDGVVDETKASDDDDILFAEPAKDTEIGGEADTKLELAKAYMEMGDREGAMSILREVQEDGTDDQIDSASELISRLNN